MFSRAIVRPPGPNFAEGLSSSGLVAPEFALALEQHRAYLDALAAAGLALTELRADPWHPDAPFVEDTAIVTARGAVITRPGAPSRRGEIDTIAAALAGAYDALLRIEAPGTLDGGDICQVEDRFLIGVSHRTNPEGARQLERHLSSLGYSAAILDVRHHPELLHLKSGLSYLGDGLALSTRALAGHEALASCRVLAADPDEAYGANAIRVNDVVLLPAGHPKLQDLIERAGLRVVALEMSEFRKMDGGLSCLSLRF
jgi:dimethylargininase